MGTRLIIEGNAVYEIDEDCQAYKRGAENKKSNSDNWEFTEKDRKRRKNE